MARSALIYDFVNKAPYSLEFRPGDVAPLNQTVMIFDRYLKGLNVDAEHADNVTAVSVRLVDVAMYRKNTVISRAE